MKTNESRSESIIRSRIIAGALNGAEMVELLGQYLNEKYHVRSI